MKYEVIEHEKLSGADFAAIIKLDSYPDALAAVKAINESDETNTPGSASVGNTGAFRVGKYVVFNAYTQACYDKFLKIVGSLESPAEPRESSVDSLARTLWDGMADGDCEAIDDRDAAIAYLCAMFPGAKATIISLESCFYFDYDGMEYGVTLDYDRDENNELRGEKIIVSDCNDKMKPVTIDRDTRDVRGTLEKFFEKAKSAWVFKNSDVDSLARTLWEGMTDSDGEAMDDRDAAIAYLCAMFPRAKATVSTFSSFYFDYDGVEYRILLDYYNGANGGRITIRDCDNTMEPLTIDRQTPNVKETLEKYFKKEKPAGDSTDSPDSPAEPSLTDRVAKLEAVVKTLNAEIKKIKKIIKK